MDTGCCCVYTRGETFRASLLRLGEIRSILPSNVGVMALTATATRRLQSEVADILGMLNPITVAVSPCKPNLMYAVCQFMTIEETLRPVIQRLQKERTNMTRIIVYCRRHEQCVDLYLYFRDGLGV